MRLLAFDTTGPVLSAAVAEGPALLAWRGEALERGQAERILPLIEAVLADAGRTWADIELLAVSHGPGGFTAVRTGIALARALALATGCGAVAVGSLEAQALAVADRAGPGPLLVLKDMRRGQLARQAFAGEGLALDEPRLVSLDEALAEARAAERLAGDGVALLGTSVRPAIEAPGDARYVARAAWRRLAGGETALPGSALHPLYLRAPDARPSAGLPLLAGTKPA